MRITRFLLVFILVAGVGCKAQTAPVSTALQAKLDRQIELTIRSQYNVPPDYTVTLGQRSKSDISGFDTLPVTFSNGDQKKITIFLISTDNNTLARLEKFDLTKAPGSAISVLGRPIRGNPKAKVTIINFDDLECPFCARMHEVLFPETQQHYGDLVRYIYLDFPLVQLHPWAMHAAVDANCLAAQSGDIYWTYVDYLHNHAGEVTGPDRNLPRSFAALDRIARQEATVSKLDTVKLDACLTKQDETKVHESLNEAEKLRIESAPAVFIDGERVDGAVPERQLWMVIDRALRASGEVPPPLPAESAPAGTTTPAPAAPPAPPATPGSGN